MKTKILAGGIGLAVTLVVHGALAAGYVAYRNAQDLTITAKLGERVTHIHKQQPLLCGRLRCPQLARQQKRRDIEPTPITEPDVLEAAMIPALGAVDPDLRKLPEIETFERPEIFENAINLDEDPSKLEKLIKRMEHRDALRDPKNKDKLKDLLSDEEVDPRARAKDLSRLTGVKEGEIGGQGSERNMGNVYSARVASVIRRVFKTPPFLDPETLKRLKVKVQVTRMSFDGAIERFRVVSKSNDPSFDDAAVAAIKQFVPSEGGTRTLPPPEPEVLRFINTKGLTITLDGRLMRR